MKMLLSIIFVFSFFFSFAQKKLPEDFGFRHVPTNYKGDTVDILVKSKKGEEFIAKPLFVFCQGSLAQPLIKYDDEGAYRVFPFNPDSLAVEFHLAIIGKPGIPLVAHLNELGPQYNYMDPSGKQPEGYVYRNHLDYYVDRNIHVIKFLQKQSWISRSSLVVAGHSEGSTIAAKLASVHSGITHLIYAGGNPMGRISTMIQQSRMDEKDSTTNTEWLFDYWSTVVADPGNMNAKGDSHRATYGFSIPPVQYLRDLKIPVLVAYGTRDWAAPFNDYLRVETIREKKRNFTYRTYPGTEHNYFPVKPNGDVDHSIFNWDKVAEDWRLWLREN
jgi:dienelactone hydrolase